MSFAVTMRLRDVEAYIAATSGGYRQLAADELAVMHAYGQVIRDEISDRWPVDTSSSRDNMVYYVVDEPGTLAVVIENDLDYAQYVHRKGTAPEPALWETLIPEVWGRWKPSFVAAMLRAVVQTNEALARAKAGEGPGWLDLVRRRYRPAPVVPGVARG